jgi:hypothetical protein
MANPLSIQLQRKSEILFFLRIHFQGISLSGYSTEPLSLVVLATVLSGLMDESSLVIRSVNLRVAVQTEFHLIDLSDAGTDVGDVAEIVVVYAGLNSPFVVGMLDHTFLGDIESSNIVRSTVTGDYSVPDTEGNTVAILYRTCRERGLSLCWHCHSLGSKGNSQQNCPHHNSSQINGLHFIPYAVSFRISGFVWCTAD